MERSVEAELLFIARALRGHLEWTGECGSLGVPAIDAQGLKERREQYRDLALEEAEAKELIWRAPQPQMGTARALPTPAPFTPEPQTKPPPSSAAPPVAPGAPNGPAAPPRGSGALQTEPAPRPVPPTLRIAGQPLSESVNSRLGVLRGEVTRCTLCPLHEERTQAVFARGSGESGVCFVGEGPGADEDRLGEPFVGKAGQLLDRMIAAMGLERDSVYVCNIVKCRPPRNRKPEPSEMQACRGYLEEQLELIQPRVIVALGATAVAGLLGLSMGITRLRGQWRLYQGKIPVMPTFHPAYLLRQPSAKREVWEDLQAVIKELQSGAQADP